MSSNRKPPRAKGQRGAEKRARSRPGQARSRPGQGAPEPQGVRSRPGQGAPEPQGVRLQKVLSAAGVASRRAAEELIAAGRVRVDGEVANVLGTRVDPARARIEVDGQRIATAPGHDYVILNKPRGVVTTAQDPQGRPTVVELVRSRRRLYPVGRLDAETTGLVLLTNHGELAHRLAHPRYGIPRIYLAEVHGRTPREVLDRLTRGVHLEDGRARAAGVRITGRARARTTLEVTMTEGRKREVRRMLEAVGHPVLSLARVSFGPLSLRGLRLGEHRRLTAAEVGGLLRAVGL